MEKELLNKLLYLLGKKKKIEDILLTLDISDDEFSELIDYINGCGYPYKYNEGKIIDTTKPINTPYKMKIGKDLIKLLVYSDTHLASVNDQINSIEELFEYGEKNGADLMIHCGDLFDGFVPSDAGKGFLKYEKLEEQLQYGIENFPKSNIPNLVVGGNHDSMWLKHDSKDILGMFCTKRKDVTYLGQTKRDIYVDGLKLHVNHGDSLTNKSCINCCEDYLDLFRENELPNMFFKAHSHKAFYFNYRDVDVFQVPALIDILPYSKNEVRDRFVGFWWIEVEMEKGLPVDFSPKLRKVR